MKDRRNSLSGELKTKVAPQAIKGHWTVSKIAGENGVHPHRITQRKKRAIEGLPEILADRRRRRAEDPEEPVSQLHHQIGRLKVEPDWPQKSLESPLEPERTPMEPEHHELSISRHCDLLGLARSSRYHIRMQILSRFLTTRISRLPASRVPNAC